MGAPAALRRKRGDKDLLLLSGTITDVKFPYIVFTDVGSHYEWICKNSEELCTEIKKPRKFPIEELAYSEATMARGAKVNDFLNMFLSFIFCKQIGKQIT